MIDEVDDRLHKERSKKDVAMWIANWLKTGFVDRLFSILLDNGFHIYLTADHGNVEAVGVGKPNQGVIAETRGERVRVYRSEALLADSAAAYPDTVRLTSLDYRRISCPYSQAGVQLLFRRVSRWLCMVGYLLRS